MGLGGRISSACVMRVLDDGHDDDDRRHSIWSQFVNSGSWDTGVRLC